MVALIGSLLITSATSSIASVASTWPSAATTSTFEGCCSEANLAFVASTVASVASASSTTTAASVTSLRLKAFD